jgi:hypothetical protein
MKPGKQSCDMTQNTYRLAENYVSTSDYTYLLQRCCSLHDVPTTTEFKLHRVKRVYDNEQWMCTDLAREYNMQQLYQNYSEATYETN